jgi:8-amino-7-oxononanoate synthase
MIQYGVFEEELEQVRGRGLFREVRDRASMQGRFIVIDGRQCLNFASNDYLALASHPALMEAAAAAMERYGFGGGASRLLAGGSELHRELEKRVANLKGTDAALIFNSGYAANTGAIPALAGEGDEVFSDELNHASIIDGCRLARATTLVFKHRDTGHLGELLRASGARRKLVVTDTVFSMDGGIAPLPEIFRLCGEHGALLYLDDAHGTGVLGEGRGALAHFALAPEPWVIQMGTFSKALGSFGAFAAGGRDVIHWLINTARSFIFSTALPPPVVAASSKALEMVEREGGRERQTRLWENRRRLTEELGALGLDTGESETPIIPVRAERLEDARSLAKGLFERGIYAPAIRPPTVPRPRLRLTVTASHTEEDIAALSRALREVLREKASS